MGSVTDNDQKTAERHLQIIRTDVPAANFDGLLAVREEAIAEAQRLCPSLIGAELVRLDDDVWLDILTWSSIQEALPNLAGPGST
jgi:hypothetical protein